MIVYFLNLGTSLEDYNYENQAIADIIKNEIGDVQFMGMSVRRKKTINVLGSSSILTCRILNTNYLLLFSIGKHSEKKIKTNIRNSTLPNRYATKEKISDLELNF